MRVYKDNLIQMFYMKVVTTVVNNPDFIEIQYYTLKKYFKGEYEFIVFNDAKEFPDYTNGGDVTLRKQIEDICKSLNIKCINILNDHHRHQQSGSQRSIDSVNCVMKYQLENPDIYLFIDSDMFLIHDFDIVKYEKYNAAFVLQQRGNIFYMWPQLCYFNMHRISDFETINWNLCDYCDAGGMTKEWLSKHMDTQNIPNTHQIRYSEKGYEINNLFLMKHLWSCSWDHSELPEYLRNKEKLLSFFRDDPRNKNGKYFCEIYDDVFLHYRAGCNWLNEGMDLHVRLTKQLKTILLDPEF